MAVTTQAALHQSAPSPYGLARKAELRSEIDQLRASIDANESALRDLRLRAPTVFLDITTILARQGMKFDPRSAEERELLRLLDERGLLADRWNRVLEEFANLS